jgi:isopenicillin N synthase-like dioxygenase
VDFSITDEKILIPQLMEQMSTVGFLVIKNIPNYNEEPFFYALQKFHRLPQEIKRKMFPNKDNPENKFKYRGYKPFVNNDQSHKEFYEEGLPLSSIDPSEKNNFPLYESQPFNPENLNFPEANSIRQEFDAQNKLMMDLGMKLTR